ncbi:MAG: HD-like signal output (HDOD) protein [Candidatus Poriferisodalaceae bacterium]|jgi:HD-like signal output (HDOD) protein
MVVGFNVVRALVAARNLGVSARNGNVPRGFFEHAVASAAGASIVAKASGQRSSDAFSAALLHDIGAVLLFKSRRSVWSEILVGPEAAIHSSLRAERTVFGISHDELGADVFEYLHFPAGLTASARDHNKLPGPDVARLSLAVIGGITLAESVGIVGATEQVAPIHHTIEALDIDVDIAELQHRLQRERAELRAVLG